MTKHPYGSDKYRSIYDYWSVLPKRQELSNAIELIDKIRKALVTNVPAMEELDKKLVGLDFPLTKTRQFDILCWTIWKWDIVSEQESKNPKGAPSKGSKIISRSSHAWKWPC